MNLAGGPGHQTDSQNGKNHRPSSTVPSQTGDELRNLHTCDKFVSSRKGKTHVPVPTSQHTSENVIDPVDAFCKSSLVYPSFLKHSLHNSYLTFLVLTALINQT